MHTLLDIVAFIAAVAVVYRLRKFLDPPASRMQRKVKSSVNVSIIIPARNEEKNLPLVLRSLQRLTFRPREIIVVDDNSSDRTASIAAQFGATVIYAGMRPVEWAGKNWACHVGAKHASGNLLLFTDADTVHKPESLRNAVNYMDELGADMLSAPSFHRNEFWWEKVLGPFYCLIYCGASPRNKQSADRAYAVGQYILVTADAYRKCGGHYSVRSEIAEDTTLAKAVMSEGRRFVLYNESPLFTVQMYKSFQHFCSGWVRLLRLGMRELSFEVALYSLLPLLALNFWNLPGASWYSYIPVVITLVCFAVIQRHIGNFSIVGILLFPVSVTLFLVLSCWALITELLEVPIRWKGRVYAKLRDSVS